MKRLSRILPFLVATALAAGAVIYAQTANANISGRVTGRDGTTPAAGLTVYIDSLVTENQRIKVRERLEAKTGRNGEYTKSGLYPGRIRVIVIEQGQEAMMRGEAVGDEIFVASGLDTRVNFDLSKAKPLAANAPAAVSTSGMSSADRDALKKKLEADAAAGEVMSKAFDAGKLAMTERRYEDAVTNFKMAAERIPTPPPPGMDVIWANLGRAHDAAKQYPEAETAYLKAIELQPKDTVALSNYNLNLSLIQFSMGKLEEGSASIKKAAELNPANAGMAYYNLGATMINRNKYKEAIDPLKKAIELDPKYGPAYYQLGLTLVGQGDMAGAIPVFQKFIDLSPGSTSSDVATAKAMIEELKKTAPTTYTSPDTPKAQKAPAAGAKAKGQ